MEVYSHAPVRRPCRRCGRLILLFETYPSRRWVSFEEGTIAGTEFAAPKADGWRGRVTRGVLIREVPDDRKHRCLADKEP